ncbi:peroxisomal membrane protein 11B-like [Ylistrum balloti]|uniref:peroxisomal membrane protein 11B-like n=1 Tax=Ylistrum balloti TaxID=509963 RepID=UPI002905CC0B|nr:peroxisomal membrane protein 11B-like [Ylistrum balloti]
MSTNQDLASQIIKFGGQTNGRDKLFRLIQYGSKLVWWHLHKNAKGPELVEKLKKLESSLSMTRKLLRFGKSLDFVKAALKSFHIKDTVLRLTITMSKINQACFLLFDHIIYAHNVGLITTDKKKWSQISARFWVVSLILNLARNVYDLVNIVQEEMRQQQSQEKHGQQINGDTDHSKRTSRSHNTNIVGKIVMQNKPVMLDLVKNLADLVLPLSTLGKVDASAGTQGFLGLISSAAGIASVWDSSLKLVP